MNAAASRAVPSAAFLDSVGVCAHWGYPDTPYGARYERVRDALVSLGVRHVRGDVFRAADLHRYGVRTTAVIDSRPDGSGDPASQVQDVRDLAIAGAIAAFEGPNEPDVFWKRSGRTYRGQPFPAGVMTWQQELYAAVKGDPALAHLPVIGPSFGETYWGTAHPFQARSLEGVADHGNMHPYPRGNSFSAPARYAGVDRYYWRSNFPSNTLDVWPINERTYRPPFGDRPMVATETGYSTYALGESERVHGVYVPRIFLEFFRLGFTRTFLYEFLDEFDDPLEREANFGLLRNDLSPKPAYRALQGLLSELAPIEDASADTPQVTVTVTPPPGYDAAALHQLVLSVGRSTLVVALWHEVSANDVSPLDLQPPRPPTELSHPPMSVDVDLGATPRGVWARTFRDSGATRPQGLEVAGRSVHLEVFDRVTLLRVRY